MLAGETLGTAPDRAAIDRFLATHHPYDTLAPATRAAVAEEIRPLELADGAAIYRVGEAVEGLYAILSGGVEIGAPSGDTVSRLEPGASFGERGLLLDGRAPYSATARGRTALLLIPARRFLALMETEDGFARFFGRRPGRTRAEPGAADVSLLRIGELMSRAPRTVGPDDSAARAARLMGEHGISCVLVTDADGRLVGLLTTGDLCARVLGPGLPPETPVGEVMTAEPVALTPEALGLDAVVAITSRGIGHLPVIDGDRTRRPVGIVTRTDLVLRQSLSMPVLMGEIARAPDTDALPAIVARVPDLLAQLVGSGAEHHVTTRLVTDVTDALTRRLIALAEARLGPAPVPYLWAACGSQGRREQTGVSDQDNCLILSDAARPEHDAHFAELARLVSDGLAACGFYRCPGDMMATNPRWRQPLATWRGYFRGWIETPDPMARMLASVMFDLRAIEGDTALFEGLQAETLARAKKNSIFIAHMVANSLTHQPPLGLLRSFALIRTGEHKDTLDLKHSGVVPVVDLARMYALIGGLPEIGTRARLVAAREAGIVSETGGTDLIDAYDLIAETRLRHQAALIRKGQAPDNYLIPATLSDLERNHLRNAFVAVKTMQSALAQGRHTVV